MYSSHAWHVKLYNWLWMKLWAPLIYSVHVENQLIKCVNRSSFLSRQSYTRSKLTKTTTSENALELSGSSEFTHVTCLQQSGICILSYTYSLQGFPTFKRQVLQSNILLLCSYECFPTLTISMILSSFKGIILIKNWSSLERPFKSRIFYYYIYSSVGKPCRL